MTLRQRLFTVFAVAAGLSAYQAVPEMALALLPATPLTCVAGMALIARRNWKLGRAGLRLTR